MPESLGDRIEARGELPSDPLDHHVMEQLLLGDRVYAHLAGLVVGMQPIRDIYTEVYEYRVLGVQPRALWAHPVELVVPL